MSVKEFRPPSAEAVRDALATRERPLTAEEVKEILQGPWVPGEREDAVALIEWFVRRYPTPDDRLRWARRAHARWVKGLPSAAEPSNGEQQLEGRSRR